MTTTYRPSVKIGGAFSLVDHFGRAVTEQTFIGKHALLFFGFTHCKRICPEALGKLSRTLNLIGADADKVQALYVSVDPARDTPEVMRAFLEASYPRFLGLTGEKARIDEMKSLYKVYAEEEVPDGEGGYDVPHTAMAFLMGPDGGYVTHFGDFATAEDIAAKLAKLLGDQAIASESRTLT